jgi:exodeoxyribonuclease VII small subunit
VSAYKVCKERIDAVEKALEKALGDTGAPTKEAPRSSKPMSPTPPDIVDDGDLPF